MTEWLDLVQWPAMAVTILASYFVASRSARRRTVGFWLFLVGNALWIAWGWSAQAIALIVLQVALAILNVRGARKNDADAAVSEDDGSLATSRGRSMPGEAR